MSGVRMWGKVLVGAAVMVLAACQSLPGNQQPDAAGTVASAAPGPQRMALDVPTPWGGELRCGTLGCRLVAVEHEPSTVVLHQVGPGRGVSRLLDRQKVAYHPDSAVWLADDLVAAAVEETTSLDIFRVQGERLVPVEQIKVGFAPRDLIVVQADNGRYQLLATPYRGTGVAWVDYAPGRTGPDRVKVTTRSWCKTPWHPVPVSRAPGAPAGGLAVACLDGQEVSFLPHTDLRGAPRTLLKVPSTSRIVPRQARPSPSGRWLYVALETGARNLRIDMDSGAFQWIAAPVQRATSVLPLQDDLVIWGDDLWLYFQRLDEQGQVLETRWLPVGGFPTGLQLLDVDGDGVDDLVVLNSAILPDRKAVEIIYGPLWEQAQPR